MQKNKLPDKYGYQSHKFPHGFENYFYKWTPFEEDILFVPMKNKVTISFDKLLGKPEFQVLNNFIITKHSYSNNLDIICEDLNFFSALYDRDHELVLGLFRLKFLIDNQNKSVDNFDKFKSIVYETVVSENIKKKISLMVEENYAHDISIDMKSLTIGKSRNILEFTNDHVKCILKSAYVIKILAIITSHYLAINGIKSTSTSYKLYFDDMYIAALNLFSDKYDIYTKTLMYIESKIKDSMNHNKPIHSQREINGEDIVTCTHLIFRKYLLTDSFLKFRLQKTWNKELGRPTESILSYYKAIPNSHLEWILKQQFKFTIVETVNDIGDEGINKIDRLKIQLSNIDEEINIMIEVNINERIKYITEIFAPILPDEKVNWYIKHLKVMPIHIVLIEQYFKSYFGNPKAIRFINNRQSIQLLLILEYILMKDVIVKNKMSIDDLADLPILPFIITANIKDNLITKKINKANIDLLFNNSYYRKIINDRYSWIESISTDCVKNTILNFITPTYEICSYDHPELNGTIIEYDKKHLIDELVQFLLNIPSENECYYDEKCLFDKYRC